jgi:hypothetical protein
MPKSCCSSFHCSWTTTSWKATVGGHSRHPLMPSRRGTGQVSTHACRLVQRGTPILAWRSRRVAAKRRRPSRAKWLQKRTGFYEVAVQREKYINIYERASEQAQPIHPSIRKVASQVKCDLRDAPGENDTKRDCQVHNHSRKSHHRCSRVRRQVE